MTGDEQEVRILEQGLSDLFARARILEAVIGQAKQNISLIRNVGAELSSCSCIYSGTVLGCGATAQPVPGATITIVEISTGLTLDVQTSAADGTYSGSALLSSGGATSISLQISASGYSPSAPTVTFNCGNNVLGSTTLTVDPGACCATFTGSVVNCDSSGNVGATVQVKLHGTGTLLWSGTTNGSGAFSGACSLATGAATSVDFVVTALSSRYNVLTSTKTLNCGSNTITAFSLTAATGYVCKTICPLPIKTTLTLTDPVIGITTLVYNSGTGVWNGTATYAYGGCSYTLGGTPITCGPASVTVTYGFNVFTSMLVAYNQISGLTGCPGGALTANRFPSGTTHTCPTSFSAVFTLADGGVGQTKPLWCTSSITLTITE